MKRVVFLSIVAILFGAGMLSAQEADTTKMKLGKKIITIIESPNSEVEVKIQKDTTLITDDIDIDLDEEMERSEKEANKKDEKCKNEFEGHWSGFDFGFNALLTPDQQFPLKEDPMAINQFRSWTFGLNMFQKDFRLIGNSVGLVSGVGLQWKNYHFDNKIELNSEGDELIWVEHPDFKYQKNRLQATYVSIPLALEIQFPLGRKGKDFFIMGGAYGNFKIGSNYKTIYKVDGKEFENKDKDTYHLNRFEYGLMARIGWDDINLFVNYSLSPLFMENEGPELYPATVGIMIVGF